MSGEKVVKHYDNGDITVVWKPDLCAHSTECFRGLPAVFDPRRRPWVDPKAAPTADIVVQVHKCPSGALSLLEETTTPTATSGVVVEATPNGPLVVRGTMVVKDAGGHVTPKEGATSFCRCGSSANKPYCDGSHARVGFQG